jgi:hypothetical protein
MANSCTELVTYSYTSAVVDYDKLVLTEYDRIMLRGMRIKVED